MQIPMRTSAHHRPYLRPVAAAATAALCCVALAACGSDDSSTGSSAEGSASAAASSPASAPAAAESSSTPTLTGGWVKATDEQMSAVFGTITNPTDSELTLDSAEVDIPATVELHEVVQEAGSAVMKKVDGGLKIPANGELALEPGGYHIMLVGLGAPITPGQEVALTLHFSDGTTSKATASARAFEGAQENYHADDGSADTTAPSDMSGMDHGDMSGTGDMSGMSGMDHGAMDHSATGDAGTHEH